jgi:hypothetical protein
MADTLRATEGAIIAALEKTGARVLLHYTGPIAEEWSTPATARGRAEARGLHVIDGAGAGTDGKDDEETS